jgi:hypothetical protein
MKYIDAEITGTEVTMLRPRTKHPVLTYLYELAVIAGIAAVVATVLWWTWNH